jgi:hypothetical protein
MVGVAESVCAPPTRLEGTVHRAVIRKCPLSEVVPRGHAVVPELAVGPSFTPPIEHPFAEFHAVVPSMLRSILTFPLARYRKSLKSTEMETISLGVTGEGMLAVVLHSTAQLDCVSGELQTPLPHVAIPDEGRIVMLYAALLVSDPEVPVTFIMDDPTGVDALVLTVMFE